MGVVLLLYLSSGLLAADLLVLERLESSCLPLLGCPLSRNCTSCPSDVSVGAEQPTVSFVIIRVLQEEDRVS